MPTSTAPDLASLACLLAAPPGAQLADSARGRATVRLFDDRNALIAHVRGTHVAAVVFDLRDAAGRPTNGTVRALRGMAPKLPLFARCRLAEPDCRALLDFARAGGTDVLVDDTSYAALRAALAAACTGAPPLDRLVARMVAAGIPTRFEPLLEALFAHVDDPAAPAHAARALGIGRRALERQLARASLPSPRALHLWCRLLVAASRLQEDTVAVERIAHDVGYSSGNALRNALQRRGAFTPTLLRGDDDGLSSLLDALPLSRSTSAPRPRAAMLVRETVAVWLVRAVRAP